MELMVAHRLSGTEEAHSFSKATQESLNSVRDDNK